MFSRIKNFFYRHRRKFLVSGVIVGGTMLLSRYALRKFMEWQEKQAKDFLEKTRKQHHFERTEKTCNQTIIALSSPLKEAILKAVDTEEYLKQLRNGTENRVELWEELKVLAFTRHSALLYSGLILVVALRTQLNIIGGHICRETINYSAPTDSGIQETYLGFCQHFVQKGIEELCALIQRHVKLIVKDIPLNKKLSLKDVEHIFWSIQASISNDPLDPTQNLSKYIFPPKDIIEQSCSGQKVLRKLATETVEVLENEETVSICNTGLSRAYSNTLDKIAEQFMPKPEIVQTHPSITEESGYFVKDFPPFTDLHKTKMPLAKLIPKIHSLTEEEVKEGSEQWIHQFIFMENIKIFGGNIYEAFSYSD